MEVDAPGCSYNPDKEHHEDIIAAAVAEEIQKGINAGMRAKGPPKHVSWQPEVDPLLQLQVRLALHCLAELSHWSADATAGTCLGQVALCIPSARIFSVCFHRAKCCNAVITFMSLLVSVSAGGCMGRG